MVLGPVLMILKIVSRSIAQSSEMGYSFENTYLSEMEDLMQQMQIITTSLTLTLICHPHRRTGEDGHTKPTLQCSHHLKLSYIHAIVGKRITPTSYKSTVG